MRVPRRTQDDIALVNRDGTNWRDLTDDKFFDRYPRWSPDGKRVAFASDRSGTYEIWTMDAEGTNLRQLTFNSPPNTSFPIWSPDGKKLCGNFEGKNGTGLGYYSFETGRYEKLSDIYAIPSWLPDSRRFVFPHEGKAFIADTATKKVRELYARPPEQIRSVGVSRDGRLLYYTLLSTESDIWLLNLE